MEVTKSMKRINVSDKIDAKDKISIGLKGHVRMYDATDAEINDGVIMRDSLGDPILEKDNLVVLRGRTFILEKLFGEGNPGFTTSSGDVYQTNISNREVRLFSVGNGGVADLQSDPFNTLEPTYDNLRLKGDGDDGRLPFLYVYTDGSDIPSEANASHISQTEFETDVKSDGKTLSEKYFGETLDSGFVGTGDRYLYYSKKFEGMDWSFNDSDAETVDGEVFKTVTLRISSTDLREEVINELGLYLARESDTENIDDYQDEIEMVTRITFDSESLSSPSKEILIEYIVYA
jgi:hypothetical protein